jgi:hypothetical protein
MALSRVPGEENLYVGGYVAFYFCFIGFPLPITFTITNASGQCDAPSSRTRDSVLVFLLRFHLLIFILGSPPGLP